MKDSVIKFSLLALFLIVTVSCGAGPALRGEAESDVATNIEDGEVDVDVNSAVSLTFTASMSVSSVNANTFFIVPSGASSSVSSNSINVKSTLDPSVCNPANAITGTIAQTGTGACDMVFELTPDSALEFNTGYVVCATNGISFCDPNRYGVFVGLQKSFTTVADSGVTYSIGGTVSGLTGTVVLQNNAADDLTITSNGSFTFATEIEANAAYTVTVLTQPSGQTCSVASGTGNAAADVENVAITCSDITYTVTPSGTNVTIDPSTAQTIASGGSSSFGVTADGGYTRSDIVGGTCPAGNWSTNTYTTGTITSDCTVTFLATDGTAPTVDGTNPTDEATDVVIDTTVAVTFSEVMDVSTITTNTEDTDCDGSFQVSDDNFITCVQMTASPTASNSNKTFTVTPSSNLGSTTTYQIRVTTSVADVAGNTLATTYTQATGFTTEDAEAPSVDSTSPEDEATDISVDTTVAVTFNEAMDVTTITTNTADTTCSGSFRVSSDSFDTCVQMTGAPTASNGDKTFTITPASSLTNSTTYKIRITTSVTDAAGNPMATTYTQATGFATAAPLLKKIFSTNTIYRSGNLGGISGADAKCMADANYPGSGTYKALLADGVNRIACTSANCATGGTDENLDWVFVPNTEYYRSDGETLIFESDSSGIFIFGTFTNSMEGNEPLWDYVWTGLNSNWTTSTNICTDESGLNPWASALGWKTGEAGVNFLTGIGSISEYDGWCDNFGQDARLMCVEQ